MSDLFDLPGKTALVTGARRGIGAGMALALGEPWARVRGMGWRFEGQAVDLADLGALKAFAARMEGEPIDVLVNNAGTIRRAPADLRPKAWWDEVIEANLSAQLLLTQTVGRGMIARGRGARRSSRPRSCRSKAGSTCRATRPPRGAWGSS